MATKLSPQQFVTKWRNVDLKERSAAHQHFIDLCYLVGHATPVEADPTGKWFTFEAGAAKQKGGQGWADVWKKGFFAWEYKVKLREEWWLFERSRPPLREAISRLSRYIATPMVSKYRVFVWMPVNVISENLVIIIARENDYFFGVLHSKPHELWARAKGTQLREAESGSRYTPTSTFETYPFPWPPGQEAADDSRVQAIAQAARELVKLRDNWLNPPGLSEKELQKRTLTNLYNQYPTWLKFAHEKLDRAVFDAYGWPHDLTDEQILERLLALNLERAKA